MRLTHLGDRWGAETPEGYVSQQVTLPAPLINITPTTGTATTFVKESNAIPIALAAFAAFLLLG